MNHNAEKKKMELVAGESFLMLFNSKNNSSYSIYSHSDYPDIVCKDLTGNTLNLEITHIEDRKGDIAAQLGRSDSRSLENVLKRQDKNWRNYTCNEDMLYETIVKKMGRDYGGNVALVIRDSSPLDWDWEVPICNIKNKLELVKNPFDRGVWLMNFSKETLYFII